MTEILFATTNPSKYDPFRYNWDRSSLSNHFQLITTKDLAPPLDIEVDENTGTFDGDSLKKARAYCHSSGRITISLDRGIEFPALNGWPGTATKQAFSGNDKMTLGIGLNKFDADRLRSQAVIDRLKGYDRTVLSVYGIAVACPDGSSIADLVTVRGITAPELRITQVGYYYDWFFIPEKQNQTLSQLTPEAYLDYTATVLWPITPKITDFLLAGLKYN